LSKKIKKNQKTVIESSFQHDKIVCIINYLCHRLRHYLNNELIWKCLAFGSRFPSTYIYVRHRMGPKWIQLDYEWDWTWL
jgi:hypothetical protein